MKYVFGLWAFVFACVGNATAADLDIDGRATLRVQPGLVTDLITGSSTPSAHPIAEAFRQSDRGEIIAVEPGVYGGFLLGLNNPHRDDVVSFGVQGVVLRARVPGTVTIETQGSDTILIQQPQNSEPFRDIAFVDLTIRTGDAAAVRFGQGGPYWGFHFHRVQITGAGRNALWGVRIYSGGDILFDECLIEDIPLEHGIYASNNVGAFTVKDSTIRNVGRAAIQFREVSTSEVPGIGPSRGRTRILNNTFVNTGKNDGASALTLRGTHLVQVIGNTFMNGFGPDAHSRGAVVASGAPLYGKPFANHCLLMLRNQILYRNPDRALVAISSTGRVMLRANTLATDTVIHPALDLSVPGAGPLNGRLAMLRNSFGRGAMQAHIKVRRFGNTLLTPAEIAALAPNDGFSWRCAD
ncbi:MAG: hypothetical protein ACI8QZ_000509 [Chlamydiales bacterium]